MPAARRWRSAARRRPREKHEPRHAQAAAAACRFQRSIFSRDSAHAVGRPAANLIMAAHYGSTAKLSCASARLTARRPACAAGGGLVLFARAPASGRFAIDVLPGMVLLGSAPASHSTPYFLPR